MSGLCTVVLFYIQLQLFASSKSNVIDEYLKKKITRHRYGDKLLKGELFLTPISKK